MKEIRGFHPQYKKELVVHALSDYAQEAMDNS